MIAADYAVVREGVSRMVSRQDGWEVCGFASNGHEAARSALQLRPDVIILDVRMRRLGGADAVRWIKEQLPQVALVVLSDQQPKHSIEQLSLAGATSFIHQADGAEQLIDGIKSAVQGKLYLTPRMSEILLSPAKRSAGEASSKTGRMTPREREIVRHIAEGKSNKEVAAALGISVRTAETHRASIMRKVQVSSTAGVVRYAIRCGIIEA